MKRILFYSPLNGRSRDTESLMQAFIRDGHKVFLLTQSPRGMYHELCENLGVVAYSGHFEEKNFFFNTYKRIKILAKFIKKHKIDIVFAHLEPANFIAVLTKYFVRAKIILNRHHINEISLSKHLPSRLISKISYTLADEIIVVSNEAKDHMVHSEKIKKSKIRFIPLGYNFNFYDQVNHVVSNEIRKGLGASFIIFSAARFTNLKRLDLSIRLIKTLIDRGLDVKLILLGTGNEFDNLKQLAKTLNIEDRIHMPGYVKNVMDYLAASDFVFHPSIIESSCVIIKEAGLIKKPCIVCKGVGDFESYFIDRFNGFLVSQHSCIEEATEIVLAYYTKKEELQQLGIRLHESIHELFSIEKVLPAYNSYLND